MLCHKLLSNHYAHEITCMLSPSDFQMADEMRRVLTESEKNKLT